MCDPGDPLNCILSRGPFQGRLSWIRHLVTGVITPKGLHVCSNVGTIEQVSGHYVANDCTSLDGLRLGSQCSFGEKGSLEEVEIHERHRRRASYFFSFWKKTCIHMLMSASRQRATTGQDTHPRKRGWTTRRPHKTEFRS